MIRDVMVWNDRPTGCNRCSRRAPRYVTPYWEPARRVCPACCVELNRLYDDLEWPPGFLTQP